jgi:hypothetical protein
MLIDDKNILFLRMVGSDKNDDSVIPIKDLVTSLYGFEQLVSEFGRICRLKGDLVVTVKPPEEGSFVIGLCVDLNLADGQLPFDSVRHLLEFLRFSSDTALKEAHVFFRDFQNIREGLNAYCEKHPFEMILFTASLPKMVKYAEELKEKALPPHNDISERMAHEIHKLIKKNGFKNFINPIVGDAVESIEISPDRSFIKDVSKVDNSNFEKLLGDNNEFLINLRNGDMVQLTGLITTLKSTRGDSLTFQYVGADGTYSLDLLPPDGEDSKPYAKYYKERVVITANVERKSMYKKPKLKLIDININQQELFQYKINMGKEEAKLSLPSTIAVSGLLPYKKD